MTECKERWRNLRSALGRKLKPRACGSVPRKKCYYLADAMQFAIPFMKVGRSTITGNSSEIPSTSEGPTEYFLSEDEDSESIPTANQQLHESIEPSLPPTPPPLPPPSTPPPQGKKRSTDETDQAFAEYSAAKAARLKKTPSDREEKKEAIQNFLNSLIPDLMELNPAQLREFKRKALLLIDEVSSPTPQSTSQLQYFHTPSPTEWGHQPMPLEEDIKPLNL